MTKPKKFYLIILFILLLIISSVKIYAYDCWWVEVPSKESCLDWGGNWGVEAIGNKCMWIKLNTDFPFIWNCIKTYKAAPTEKDENATTPVNVFPKLVEALMNLLMTVILIMSLLMIVVSWILIASSWGDSWKYSDWIKILKKVAVWMALLWASWVILKVINPNFFV